MAELSTVARPYAEALFAAANHDKAKLQAWGQQVQVLADIAETPDVKASLGDPRIEDAKRGGILLGVSFGLTKSKVDQAIQNFIELLVSNDRLSLLPQISAQFRALKDKADGIAEAVISSAFPMPDEQVADLIKLLEPKFGLKLKPHVIIDSALIGGVRVVVGDQVLDTSVQAQLQRMRDKLAA